MATVTDVFYSGPSGSDLYWGRSETAADALAATLTSGQDALLTTTGLNVADVDGAYPPEGKRPTDSLIRYALDWGVGATYNYNYKFAAILGGPAGTSGQNGQANSLLKFDEDANNWFVTRNTTPDSAVHAWDNNVVDPRTGIMYKSIDFPQSVGNAFIHVYDLVNDTALDNIAPPVSAASSVRALAINPNKGTKGYLYCASAPSATGYLHYLDLADTTGAWVEVTNTLTDLTLSNVDATMHYNPASDKLIIGPVRTPAAVTAATQFYIVDNTDTITRTTGTVPDVTFEKFNFVPVPNSVESVGLAEIGGTTDRIITLNTDTEVWGADEALPTNMAAQTNPSTNASFFPVLEKGYIHCMFYDFGGASQSIIWKR